VSRERRLDGAIVVLTRRREDNAVLAEELRQRGAEVIELPCIRTEKLHDTGQLAEALTALEPSDLLVVTSRAGVDAIADVMPRAGIACGVAAVGEASAERAAAAGLKVRFVASSADGATLGHELPLPRGTVVLARSDLADADLPAALRRRGADVRDVVAYHTVATIDGDPGSVRRALDRGPVTIVAASPSAVDALATAVGAELLRHASFVAIGPRTAQRIRERIGRAVVVAANTDDDALVRAVPSPQREEATP